MIDDRMIDELQHTSNNTITSITERIAQSKRARAGSLAIVDYLIATSGANLYPPGVWFADVMSSLSGVTFVLFCFVFVFMLSLNPTATRVPFFFFPFFLFGMSLFPSIFCTITVFSLYGEYVVRFPPSE